MSGIDGHVHATRVLVFVEDLLKGLAAVGRAEDPALGTGPVRMAEGRNVETLRIVGIDGNRRDLLRVAQTEVLPCLARVLGAIHAVTGGEVGAL